MWAALYFSPNLADVARGRENNFNLIRFLAASTVILYHEFAVAPTPGAMEPFYWLTRGRDDGGSIAVAVFFAISGFLVTQSFVARGGSVTSFLGARVLRIFPALWAAVIFTIIVSSFASPIPWGAYLTHPQTLKYWAHDSFLFDLQYRLPGAFLHVPMAGNVNGPLWTLPMEFRMYMVCLTLGVLGIYRLRAAFNVFLVLIVVIGYVAKPESLPLMFHIWAAHWSAAFLCGAALFVNRRSIRLSIPLALLLLGVTYFVREPTAGRFLILPSLSYATLCFALHPALFFRPFTRVGDYSYGLYIYAFPLQQQVVFYHPGIHWFKGLLITYPIALGVAVISWHMIEKPALSLKRFVHSRTDGKADRKPRLAALVGR